MRKIFYAALMMAFCSYAQNASDYFPSAQDFKWYFKNVPFDSLNNKIDSLTSYGIDSFATDIEFEGRLSHLVLSKYGTPENIIQSPYTDSSYIHTTGSDLWNYIKEIGGISIPLPFDYEGWYSVYRLSSPLSAVYTVFTKDTLLTIGSTSLNLRFEVTGMRLADELLSTAYGELVCKKFLLRPAVKYIPPIPIPITLVAITDTVWIAPGYYVVKTHQPSANADLSLFGIPPFYIPGSITEAVPVPPILNAEPEVFNIQGEGDTVLAVIKNIGEGSLNWTAEIVSGSSWLAFSGASSGAGGDSLFIAVAENDSPSVRAGIIEINAEGAFSSPRLIYINQEEGIIVSVEEIPGSVSDYSLEQNYPNPFNSSTIIGFSVKQSGYIKLVLYDVLGTAVLVIAEGNYAPGSYKFRLDAENFSSGIYIYTMTADGFRASGKLVLLR